MADVDEIWLEMQREQPKGKSKELTGKSKAVDLHSLQKQQQSKGKKAVSKKQLDASLRWMQNWSSNLKIESQDFGASALAAAKTEDAMQMVEAPTTLIDALEDIPSGTPETFLAYLQRDINCLSEESLGIRLQSIQKLERILVRQADSLSTDILDAVCDSLLKPLLKRMKDKSEKIRELAVKILQTLIENTTDLSGTLPYVFPTLVARLGCEDLDGVAHLPEVARPDPEQKPTEISRPVEESEEVRLCIGRFVAALLGRCTPSQVYSYVDEATGLIRAQAMDPYHEVKALACETMIAFCYNHHEMLLHFAEPLARSLTSCLMHNHAKLRINALKAITACLVCGVWKHNFEIFQILMAWQDPNKVQVKAFYEGVTNVNYMSTLSFDRHPAVRRFWYETMANWLLTLVDKVDLEPYIFPYLLTGLCDENEDLALEVFWLIERCGDLYEREHEEDLRKTKQYGFDYAWTYSGRAFVPFPLQGVWGGDKGVKGHVRKSGARGPDFLGGKALNLHQDREHLDFEEEEEDDEIDDEEDGLEERHKLGKPVPLPKRDYTWGSTADIKIFRRLPRPSLGSRSWVRTHTRRYIKATFNDVVDFRDCTALNAGRLLCMSLAYTEEGITEWLQPMLAALQKFYAGRAWASSGSEQKSEVVETYECICKLLGAFLPPGSLWEQLQTSLDPDSLLQHDQRVAYVQILARCLEGQVETLQSIDPPDPSVGLGHLEEVLPELISMMHTSDLLLQPTPESRKALWVLLFSFLEPLRHLLSQKQISQLLFVALALAAKPPSDEDPEAPFVGAQMMKARGKQQTPVNLDGPQLLDLEAEELVDAENLHRALAALSKGLEESAAQAPSYSLDSLEDDDMTMGSSSSGLEEVAEDPRSSHQLLFQRAFLEVIDNLEDNFQVFRSVLYLTPLAVILRPDHQEVVMRHLGSFVNGSSTQQTCSAGFALAVQLAFRAAKLRAALAESSPLMQAAGEFIWKIFQLTGKMQADAITGSCQNLSYMVAVSGFSQWRRFFLRDCVDPRLALFPMGQRQASEGFRWLISISADQELYKKFHMALEHAETVMTGRTSQDFVIEKARTIRIESERRSNMARHVAASTLLLVLRSMLLDNRGTHLPWRSGSDCGSARGLFIGVASLLTTAEPTMAPMFVRPAPPSLLIYAAETLHLLLHLPQEADNEQQEEQAVQTACTPFRLLDDAAQAIHKLPCPAAAPRLPPGVRLSADEEEQLIAGFIGSLIDLNLTLPPDPNAKHAPASLDQAAGDIVMGWDASLDKSDDGSTLAVATAGAAVPAEVSRLLAQTPECQRWNAALALYILGIDLAAVFEAAFHANIAKWQKSKAQAKVLIAKDVLQRGQAALKASKALQ